MESLTRWQVLTPLLVVLVTTEYMVKAATNR
jgi:hypothetical protein